MKISKETIDQIILASRIEDVVGEYIKLHKVGKNYVALCPFHSEKTPSFVVSPEKQIYKCFGCSVSGNVITFLREYLNISFSEAIKILADRYGIEIKYEDVNRKDSTIFDYINQIFQEELLKSKEHLEYLKARNISEKEIVDYGLGLCKTSAIRRLNDADNVFQQLKNLLVVNDRGFLIFENRITVPIKKINQTIIGYTARSIEKNPKIKYINSPNSDVFNKSKLLFGLDKALPHVNKTKEVIVVEGVFDAIVMSKYFPNTVALLTANITEYQSHILSKYAKKVILMLDNDHAGITATEKAILSLFKKGVEVRVVEYESKDPDEAIRKEKDIMQKIKEPKDPVIKTVNEISALAKKEDIEGTAKKVKLLKEMIDSLNNDVLKITYSAILSNKGITL